MVYMVNNAKKEAKSKTRLLDALVVARVPGKPFALRLAIQRCRQCWCTWWDPIKPCA